MCKCTPSIRTPFCGKGNCVWPNSKPANARNSVVLFKRKPYMYEVSLTVCSDGELQGIEFSSNAPPDKGLLDVALLLEGAARWARVEASKEDDDIPEPLATVYLYDNGDGGVWVRNGEFCGESGKNMLLAEIESIVQNANIDDEETGK